MSKLEMFRQVYPPAPKYSVNDIPDLSGKVIIVTGANTGVGKETAKVHLEDFATLDGILTIV